MTKIDLNDLCPPKVGEYIQQLENVIRMMIEDFEDRGSGRVTQATINRGKDALGIKYREEAANDED